MDPLIMINCRIRNSAVSCAVDDEVAKNRGPVLTNSSVHRNFFRGRGSYARNFFFGGGSTNSVEDRGQRERGSGGVSPLVRGFTQFANE
jgi:hypothetical protein